MIADNVREGSRQTTSAISTRPGRETTKVVHRLTEISDSQRRKETGIGDHDRLEATDWRLDKGNMQLPITDAYSD